MRAVVLGYHNVGCAGLDVLVESGDEVVAVYTHPDDPGEEIWFDSVAERAGRYGLGVHRPEEINRPEWVARIRDQAPDIIFSFYYRRMVSDEILAIPRLGAMNLHGSYLPRYRGRCPVNWVLINGETETGVTLHYMVRKPDAGDIVIQRPVPIEHDDTALTLHAKIAREGASILRDALPAIREGVNPRIPQDLESGSYFGGRRPEDGRIDWNRPANEVHNLVRGVTHPYPGAFSMVGDTRLTVWSSKPVPARPSDAAIPGRVHLEGGGLSVEAASGRLEILRCQLDGQPEMDAARFVARQLVSPGTILR